MKKKLFVLVMIAFVCLASLPAKQTEGCSGSGVCRFDPGGPIFTYAPVK